MADSSTSAQPSHRALETFRQKLATEWKGIAYCQREYFRTAEIERWMLRTDTDGVATNAGLLLIAVYDRKPNQIYKPTSYDLLVADRRCLIVGVVSSTSALEMHFNFYAEQLVHDLEIEGVEDARGIIERFEERKWHYCPCRLSLGMQQTFEDPRTGRWIMPFCKRQPINAGGTAQVWKVSVPEALVPGDLAKSIERSRYSDNKHGICYTLALKTFTEDISRIFHFEKGAYLALRGKRGMIHYLGDYEIDERLEDGTVARTWNILLEYGDEDLEEFFASPLHYPPILNAETIKFWGGLVNVAEALERMHNLDVKREDGQSQQYYGWHADLKPDNILRVHGEFKLAGFGFAKFKNRDLDSIAEEFMIGGTETYSAPECDRNRRGRGTMTSVTQKIDTWSFGCVLSVSATWVVLGYQGVLAYHLIRQGAIQKLRKRRKNGEKIRVPAADDAFHNGLAVLSEVRDWHNYLRSVLRKSDTITDLILDLIDYKMLVGKPPLRLDSRQLCSQLHDSLALAQRHYQQLLVGGSIKPVAESIVEALLSVDNRPTVSSGGVNGATTASSSRATSTSARDSRTGDIQGADSTQSPLGIHTENTSTATDPVTPRRASSTQGEFTREKEVVHMPGVSLHHGTEPVTPMNGHPPLTSSPRLIQGESPSRNAGSKSPADSLGPFSSPTTATEPAEPFYVDPAWPVYKVKDAMKRQEVRRWFGKQPSDEYLKNFLKDRDIKFLIDNDTTMVRFWDAMEVVFDTLVKKIGRLDDDALDLEFTIGTDHNAYNAKERQLFTNFKKAKREALARQVQFQTDMMSSLTRIFDEYLRNPARPMTLIVLTDGVWVGTVNSDGTPNPVKVELAIAEFLRKRLFTEKSTKRWFTIEFISFGNAGLEILTSLDDEMAKKYSVPDVIDTVPVSGDVYKMILGSLLDELDAKPMSAASTSSVHAPTPLNGFETTSYLSAWRPLPLSLPSTLTSLDELLECAKQEGAAICIVDGTIEGAEAVKVTSDTTILGKDYNAILKGVGLKINGKSGERVRNVIVRNLSIDKVLASTGDAIGIQYAENVWVDHCDIQGDRTQDDKDLCDGLFDRAQLARAVVSLWHGSRLQQLLRERERRHHSAQLLVEGNVFVDVGKPLYAVDGDGFAVDNDNDFGGAGNTASAGSVSVPYEYTLMGSAEVASAVFGTAGATLTF
ncbi:Uu.00g021080.m01.CDS01 [Anthostomella pinea]|uniref:Uu.00g021080.m01.CDS01 n=1 Tax=Anthostomella pinea TaxID=933095 RepID=A0AAI8VZK7_9PEZI|nr:Uu.00g021080.m01.CDS01 [Anthostomella pinea]